jgi:uncharacterized OB-fold protein
MAIAKPKPVVDHLSAPFWEGCGSDRLLLQTCTQCGMARFPPGPQCLACGSEASQWKEASGRARVYSWIVVRHPVPSDIYAADVPYVVALVDLDEGARMPTNIVDCAPEAITAGMALEVCFRDVGGTRLPQFRPASPR